MNNEYKQSKKARYVASIVYLAILGLLLMGTLLSEQHKEEQRALSQQESLSVVK